MDEDYLVQFFEELEERMNVPDEDMHAFVLRRAAMNTGNRDKR